MNQYDNCGKKVFSTEINGQRYTLQEIENKVGDPMYVLLQDESEVFSCYANEVQNMLGYIGNMLSPSLELRMRQALHC